MSMRCSLNFAYYEANIARESRPFPGVVAVLERLAAEGATLAVCTNKQEHLSRLLLQELDLEDYFSGRSRDVTLSYPQNRIPAI